MRNYTTVSEAVNDLTGRGYTLDFNIVPQLNAIGCSDARHILAPDEFEIDEVHRFEGETDPGDEMILYAISSSHSPVKGILVSAYGAYDESTASALVQKLATNRFSKKADL